MVKKQSIAKGFTQLGAASILNKVLSIIYVPFLTFMIGDVGNGIASIGYVVYLLVYQVTYMGVPVALSKMVSEQIAVGRYHDSMRTLRIANTMMFVMGAVLGGAMALSAGWIARVVKTPQAAMTLLALSPTVLVASFSSSLRGYFQGRHNMTPTAVSQVVEQAANTAFTLLFAWLMLKLGRQYAVMPAQMGGAALTDPELIHIYSLQWGAAGSGLGTTAGAIFSAVYLMIAYRRHIGEIKAEAAQEDRSNLARGRAKLRAQALTGKLVGQIFRYAAPITLGALIVYMAGLVDMTFTKDRLLAAGFDDTEATARYGILSVQYTKIIGVPLALANTLAVVMLPNISGTAAIKDQQALHAKINGSLRAVFLLTLPAAALLAALAEPVIRLLFPFNPHGMDLLMLGSWVLVLTALVQLETSVLQGIGRMRLPVIHMAVALLLKIAVNYTLIGIKEVNILGVPVEINVRGAVAGSAVCYGMAALWNAASIRKATGYRASLRRVLFPPLVSSLLMAAAAWGTWAGLDALLAGAIASVYLRTVLTALPAFAAAAAVYTLGLLLTRGVSREEVLGVPAISKALGRNRLERILDKFHI